MLDRAELRVVGQDRGIELLGGGNAECVSIGDSMFALNFGRCFDERKGARNLFDLKIDFGAEGVEAEDLDADGVAEMRGSAVAAAFDEVVVIECLVRTRA